MFGIAVLLACSSNIASVTSISNYGWQAFFFFNLYGPMIQISLSLSPSLSPSLSLARVGMLIHLYGSMFLTLFL